jgi:dipeptidyl aminopeptidase/acylaminoacyl peptidase
VSIDVVKLAAAIGTIAGVALALAAGCGGSGGAQRTTSPPRGVIAYIAADHGRQRLHLRALRGGPARTIAAADAIQLADGVPPEFVFERNRGAGVEIFAIRPNGTALRRIARVPRSSFRSVSPDGRWATFVMKECVERPPHVRLVEIGTGRTYDFRASTSGGSLDLVWSPTSKKIAYVVTTREDEPCRGLTATSEIYRAWVNDRRPTRIARTSFAGDLAWAPNGKYVAATADCFPDSPGCEHLLASSGGQMQSLPTQALLTSNPIWSRKRLFVVLADKTGEGAANARLVAMELSRTKVRVIATIPEWNVRIEAISPDGSKVAIRGFSPERLWVVDVATGDVASVPWPPKPLRSEFGAPDPAERQYAVFVR